MKSKSAHGLWKNKKDDIKYTHILLHIVAYNQIQITIFWVVSSRYTHYDVRAIHAIVAPHRMRKSQGKVSKVAVAYYLPINFVTHHIPPDYHRLALALCAICVPEDPISPVTPQTIKDLLITIYGGEGLPSHFIAQLNVTRVLW